MIIYKELLEKIVSIMQKLQSFVGEILDEFHVLVGQLWDNIWKNNGKLVERLLEEHERKIDEGY